MTLSERIEFSEKLKARLKQFTLNIIKLFAELPKNEEAKIIGRQLLRSGSSVYANYRASCRARSKPEFFSKMCIVVEEADETEGWIDLLISSGICNTEHCRKLHAESIEVLKIVSTARKNVYK